MSVPRSKFASFLFRTVLFVSILSLALGAAPLPLTRVQAAPRAVSVGVVLPTIDEPRWVQDAARLQSAFDAAGYTVHILFSQGDTAVEKTNVETLIGDGIQVLIICPQDSFAAAAAVEEAHAAGIKVISYDRLILNTLAPDYYITFDSFNVGQVMAQYLVAHAPAASGNPLYLYAGAATDNNSFLFLDGSWNVLQPRIADGTFVIKNSSAAVSLKNNPTLTHFQLSQIIDQITTNWDYFTAGNLAKANLAAVGLADKGNVAILAPNDGTARAIADAFALDADIRTFVITGQDAEKASVQYILDGKQTMTVFKDIRTLSTDAAAAAVTFLHGQIPPQTKTYNNGLIDVPARPTVVLPVDRGTVKPILIDSGYYAYSDFNWHLNLRQFLPAIRH
jgi:putative multiple sugar transport system substrate-binding protein